MSVKVNIPPFQIEELNETESWLRFKQRFGIAILNVDFTKNIEETEDADRQRVISQRKGGALLTAMGEKGMRIFYEFRIPLEDIRYDTVVDRFDTYFRGRENKTILRHRMMKQKQGENEPLSDYIARVVDLSMGCQLGDLREDMAIHVMLGGMRNEDLVQEILRIPDLNMNRFTTTCAGYEVAERTMTAFQGKEVEEVSGVRGEEGRCRGCGKKGHYLYECPDIECYKCLNKGHMAKDCNNRVKCRNCGKQGHRAQDCDDRETRQDTREYRGSGNRGGYQRGRYTRGGHTRGTSRGGYIRGAHYKKEEETQTAGCEEDEDESL